MPAQKKGHTERVTLRMSPLDRAIINSTRERMTAAGVKLSANDVVLYLIQASMIPTPLTLPEAREAITLHWAECSVCGPTTPPACAAGVHHRDAYTRILVRTPQGA